MTTKTTNKYKENYTLAKELYMVNYFNYEGDYVSCYYHDYNQAKEFAKRVEGVVFKRMRNFSTRETIRKFKKRNEGDWYA